MMYRKDKHGEYQLLYRFVDAWPGGWVTIESRRYADGNVRFEAGNAHYAHESTRAMGRLHTIYLSARAELLEVNDAS